MLDGESPKRHVLVLYDLVTLELLSMKALLRAIFFTAFSNSFFHLLFIAYPPSHTRPFWRIEYIATL